MSSFIVQKGKVNYLINDSIRKNFKFVTRNTNIIKDGKVADTFPSIVLIHTNTNIPIGYPGYERYIGNLIQETEKSGATMAKKAKHICLFLNYVLWNTDINELHRCSIKDIRGFLVYLRDDYPAYNASSDWLRVKDAARELGMSMSSFEEYFKRGLLDEREGEMSLDSFRKLKYQKQNFIGLTAFIKTHNDDRFDSRYSQHRNLSTQKEVMRYKEASDIEAERSYEAWEKTSAMIKTS